jgi:hypothetical protein
MVFFSSIESLSAPITLVFLFTVLLVSIPDHVFVVNYSINIAIMIGACLIMILQLASSFFLDPSLIFLLLHWW